MEETEKMIRILIIFVATIAWPKQEANRLAVCSKDNPYFSTPDKTGFIVDIYT